MLYFCLAVFVSVDVLRLCQPPNSGRTMLWTHSLCNVRSLHAGVEIGCHSGIHVTNLGVWRRTTRMTLQCRHTETRWGPDKNAKERWRLWEAQGQFEIQAAEWAYSKDNRVSGHLQDAMCLMSNEVGLKWSHLSFVYHVHYRQSSFQYPDTVTLWCFSKRPDIVASSINEPVAVDHSCNVSMNQAMNNQALYWMSCQFQSFSTEIRTCCCQLKRKCFRHRQTVFERCLICRVLPVGFSYKHTAWIVGQVSVLTIGLLTFLLVPCDGLLSPEPIPLVKRSGSQHVWRQTAFEDRLGHSGPFGSCLSSRLLWRFF